RQDSSFVYNPESGTNDSPFLSDWDPIPDTTIRPYPIPAPGIDLYYLWYRNTFHWGPRQANGLPTDLTKLVVADYRRGRMRHWLHEQTGLHISQTLSMQQDPSPDNGTTAGQTVWFGYDGKPDSYHEGTQSQPALIARR